MLTRIKKWIAVFGQSIFAIGYTIGTGYVTPICS